jgi:DNA-binding MarR family transcriptional regulator
MVAAHLENRHQTVFPTKRRWHGDHVSRAVQRLKHAGCVERHEDTDDRRSKVLQLTPARRSVYQKIWPLVVARQEYIFSAPEPGERSTLACVMDAVQRRTEELIRR